MTFLKKIGILSVFIITAAFVTPQAKAAIASFDLTYTDSGTGLTPPAGLAFGSITVTENTDVGSLVIELLLNDPYRIHQSTNNHPAFAFQLAGLPEVIISELDSRFTYVVGGEKVAGYGNFNYTIQCKDAVRGIPNSGCPKGYNASNPLSLSFVVKPKSGILTLNSFEKVGGAYFTVDVQNSAGKTGNIASTDKNNPSTPTDIPEPGTLAIISLGLIGIRIIRSQKS